MLFMMIASSMSRMHNITCIMQIMLMSMANTSLTITVMLIITMSMQTSLGLAMLAGIVTMIRLF